MNEIVEKLSAYNIFNYFVPGVLFAAFATRLTSHKFTVDDILIGAIVYYFYGLIICRIGSPLSQITRLIAWLLIRVPNP